MLTPLLSEADPRISAEGSIDPLGTYAIADALAVRLVPGVRERQQHPRFLTAVAVSLSLYSDFPEELLAADGISEPWQVFEWYLVEGMVRTAKERGQLRGLPGQDKAAAAIKDGVPLSVRRYLKTPTVFGFHGVYRALARDVEVERAGRLGETGYVLVTAWEKDQGLEGFCGTGGGRGQAVRRQLVEAIRDGLDDGHVARKAGWGGWQFFIDHLGIYQVGRRESGIIREALLSPAAGFRSDVLRFLTGEVGRRVWREESSKPYPSERVFHAALLGEAGAGLAELLRAIDAYERYSRLLQDAFDDVLFTLSRQQSRIQPEVLARAEGVKRAATSVPKLFLGVAERLSPFGMEARFQDAFGSLAEPLSDVEWLERLLEHHRRVQRAKPPAGKAPWFDRFGDGTCMIRTGYVREDPDRQDDSYVHAYRTASLWSFAHDLKQVK